MPGSSPETLQSNIDHWLAGLGFSRGNPFATAEANQERALLPEFFVDVDGYERIKSDQTVIVFAPRGGGKSALRLVLASQSAPTDPEATTLAVEYTDFDTLIAQRRAGHTLAVEDHMPRLLRAGAAALLDTLCGSLPNAWPTDQLSSAKRRGRSSTAAIPAPLRSRLSSMIRAYHPALLDPAPLYERLHALDPAFAPDWSCFIESITQRSLRGAINDSALRHDEVAQLLADLNDYGNIAPDSAATPVEQVLAFAHLAHMLGFRAVHFLIDRLDEHQETADNYLAQADMLEPLLAHLPLMELYGVAFKFFLAHETHKILLGRPTIRRDRLTDYAVTVTWDQKRLKHLLDERLAVYSDEQVHDLLQICLETHVELGRERAPRQLGEWLEGEMLQVAQGSPRRLLVAGQLLFQAHVQRNGPSGLLEQADWDAAKSELVRKMPLLLRLQRDARSARIGDHEVKLSPLEQRILKALTDHNGTCDRETLVNSAWDTAQGVSDEAIAQAVRKLREKLENTPNNPIYLKTERGRGFKLANYEVD